MIGQMKDDSEILRISMRSTLQHSMHGLHRGHVTAGSLPRMHTAVRGPRGKYSFRLNGSAKRTKRWDQTFKSLTQTHVSSSRVSQHTSFRPHATIGAFISNKNHRFTARYLYSVELHHPGSQDTTTYHPATIQLGSGTGGWKDQFRRNWRSELVQLCCFKNASPVREHR